MARIVYHIVDKIAHADKLEETIKASKLEDLTHHIRDFAYARTYDDIRERMIEVGALRPNSPQDNHLKGLIAEQAEIENTRQDDTNRSEKEIHKEFTDVVETQIEYPGFNVEKHSERLASEDTAGRIGSVVGLVGTAAALAVTIGTGGLAGFVIVPMSIAGSFVGNSLYKKYKTHTNDKMYQQESESKQYSQKEQSDANYNNIETAQAEAINEPAQRQEVAHAHEESLVATMPYRPETDAYEESPLRTGFYNIETDANENPLATMPHENTPTANETEIAQTTFPLEEFAGDPELLAEILAAIERNGYEVSVTITPEDSTKPALETNLIQTMDA